MLDDAGTRTWLEDLYRPGSADHVRLNFVASVDGSVVGADGTSDSLSSVVDRRILGVIRELADVVLVGAGTVRAERYVLPAGRPWQSPPRRAIWRVTASTRTPRRAASSCSARRRRATAPSRRSTACRRRS
ncbi:hypothetical protein BC477_13870 [Clavibacter michiganensis subsp. michiganensis]|uniref:Bacterial bifunctional deaminase-reductase C-terminal domain-containing protein n=1 Tax=Clavibacter michiganensis subsp. michiganensis TaxID=33013 RepID=A0A251XIF6_CLAMM|nr:hypothetical protein BC477_13870 [Clavibacter michiganensis subsp. michiganensis]OUE02885.1 hypothetical protein CMMCAS07_12775 [Clavibacter michiganensis subsp. michiganensis]